MPRIAEFYGIVIAMFYNDHDPPHIHAIYGEHRATFAVDSGALLDGELPRRARALVLEWSALHQAELLENWRRARGHEVLRPVAPLD